MQIQRPNPITPPWLHRWAVLTVCATFILLLLGAVVTTFRVGMADPVWPTSPLYIFFMSWTEPSAGFLIEHSHRFAGWTVGLCTIALTLALWLQEPRRWMRWLGVTVLFCVVVQGLLGGFRVRLNAILGTDLAIVHGIFAQVVFSLMVSIAVATSQGWWTGVVRRDLDGQSNRIKSWSLVLCVLVFSQIVLGAWVRHTDIRLAQRGHLLFAFGVIVAGLWLIKLIWDEHRAEEAILRPACFIGVLLFMQVILGVESWMFRFSDALPRDLQQITVGRAIVRTLHVLGGYALVGTSVLMALRCHRRVGVIEPAQPEPEARLEGAL